MRALDDQVDEITMALATAEQRLSESEGEQAAWRRELDAWQAQEAVG